MSVRWYSIVVDSHDVAALGRWWAELLDWKVAYEAEDEYVIVPPFMLDESREQPPLTERGQGLVFVRVPETKELKNRLHLDLAPGPDDDHAAEVDRLIALGATRADVGQGDVAWVVLADPEGNEFCVLTPRDL
jgi:hypothetical protein